MAVNEHEAAAPIPCITVSVNTYTHRHTPTHKFTSKIWGGKEKKAHNIETNPVRRLTGCVITTSRLISFYSIHLSVHYHVCPLNIYIPRSRCLFVRFKYCPWASMHVIMYELHPRARHCALMDATMCIWVFAFVCVCVCVAKNIHSKYVCHRLSFKKELAPSSS